MVWPAMVFHGIFVASHSSASGSLFINEKTRGSLAACGAVSDTLPQAGMQGGYYMNLEILTPEKKLFSGEVYGVQMPGISGSFEVLEKHAPLVSALKAGQLKVLKDKNKNTALFNIQSGFVEVLNNKVTVLVEGAVAVE